MVARHLHRHIQRLTLTAQHGEMGLHALLADIDGPYVGIFGKTVGNGRPRYLRQNLAHHRIIDAQHGQAVERQVVQELDEGLLQDLLKSPP